MLESYEDSQTSYTQQPKPELSNFKMAKQPKLAVTTCEQDLNARSNKNTAVDPYAAAYSLNPMRLEVF